MDNKTEPKKNILIARFFDYVGVVIVLGIPAFLAQNKDFDSPILKPSLIVGVIIGGFLYWLRLKNLITIPQKLKDNAVLLNLIYYFLFAGLWCGIYFLLQNILPCIAPPEKWADLIHSLEPLVFIAAFLLAILITKELGKQKRKISVSNWSPKSVAVFVVVVFIAGAALSLVFPNPSAKHRDEAMHFMRQHDYQAALTSMNQAIQESDKDSPVLANYYADRAYTYEKLGKYGEAIYDLAQSIDGMRKNKEATTNPFEVASLYSRRGDNYLVLGKYQSAIDDYSEVLRSDPQNSPVYANRSIAYEKLGKYDLAVQDQEKATELKTRSQENKH